MTSSKPGLSRSQTMETSRNSGKANSKRPRNTNERRINTTRHATEHSAVKTACLALGSKFVNTTACESNRILAEGTERSFQLKRAILGVHKLRLSGTSVEKLETEASSLVL